MEIDLKSLKELMRALQQYELTELEVESEGTRFRLVRGGEEPAPSGNVGGTNVHITPHLGGGSVMPSMAPPSTAPVSAAPPAASAAPAAASEEAEDDASIHYVTSPFVGTFYEAPSPEAGAFVKVGDKVKAGQSLCIVEAMKLMNEIESDAAGEILEVLASNGKPVEYGDRLFKLKKA